MKISVYILLIFALILGAIVLNLSTAQAATYYVQKSGSNANTGLSLAQSFLTIGKACSTMTSGDRTYLGPGTWNTSISGSIIPVYDNNVSWYPIPDSARPTINGNAYADYGFYVANLDSVTLYGMEFTACHIGVYLYQTFYCHVERVSSHDNEFQGDDNAAGVMLYTNLSPPRGYSLYNSVRACTLYSNYMSTSNENTGGIFLYFQRYALIDSNVIHDQDVVPDSWGIRVKHTNRDCTVRYNFIYDCNNGIGVTTQGVNDSIYGNVLYGIDYVGITAMDLQSHQGTDSIFIFNNTIYASGCGVNIGRGSNIDQLDVTNIGIWNNIVVNSQGGGYYEYWVSNRTHTFLFADYNDYYNSGTSTVVSFKGTTRTLAQHIANDFQDSNSVSADPVFLSTTFGNANFLHLDTANSPASVLTGGRGDRDAGYEIYMGAYDPDVEPPADVTPPTISAVSANPDLTSVVITWTTNESATSRVIGDVTSYSATLTTSHSQTISGLDPSTYYEFQAVSCDASGNCDTSTVNNFTTDAAGGSRAYAPIKRQP